MSTDTPGFRLWNASAFVASALVFAACSYNIVASSTPSVAEPTGAAPSATGTFFALPRMTALLEGTLESEGSCVRIKYSEGEETYTVVWPADFRHEFDGVTLTVEDIPLGETRSWKIGDNITIGGGETRVLDESLADSVPDECSGPYWVFGGWIRQ